MLDFSRTWLPYLYLYGVGGGVFLIGMFIILRSRSLKLERIRHREWYHILIFGLVYYMCLHGFFYLVALFSPAHHPDLGFEQTSYESPFEFRLINESSVDSGFVVSYAWDGIMDSSFFDSNFIVLQDDSVNFSLNSEDPSHYFWYKNFKKDSIQIEYDSTTGLSDSIPVLDSSRIIIESGLRLVVKNSPSEVDTLYAIKQFELIDSTRIIQEKN